MAGLFPCSWSLPMVRRNNPKPVNYACNLPAKPKPPHCSYLPAIIPAEEQCALVADEGLDQAIQQIQRETNCDFEPSQVLNMTREFNRNFDNAIEKLNTMPPKKETVDQRQLLDLMVAISRYSHILEGFVQKKNQH